MGPFLPMRKTVDEFEWAHSYMWEKLPITLNGPILACEKNCQWHWMGPILLTRKVADSIEWAHSYSWAKLLIALNGPILIHKKSCQWLWMGLLLAMRKTVIDFEWADSYKWDRLLIALSQFLLTKKTVDNCEWVHSHSWEKFDDSIEWAQFCPSGVMVAYPLSLNLMTFTPIWSAQWILAYSSPLFHCLALASWLSFPFPSYPHICSNPF